jgi:hypothetical protein
MIVNIPAKAETKSVWNPGFRRALAIAGLAGMTNWRLLKPDPASELTC